MSHTCPEENNEHDKSHSKGKGAHSKDLSDKMTFTFKEDQLADSEVSGLLRKILSKENKKGKNK